MVGDGANVSDGRMATQLDRLSRSGSDRVGARRRTELWAASGEGDGGAQPSRATAPCSVSSRVSRREAIGGHQVEKIASQIGNVTLKL